LAVTSEGWLVVSESEEGNASVEECKFDDTLFLELTSLILWGELKIHFASVGTSYCAAMRFNTVTEGLYREAIDLLLDGIDQVPAQGTRKDDEDTASILENWPIGFRTEALRYRPKLQGILAATRWPSVVDGIPATALSSRRTPRNRARARAHIAGKDHWRHRGHHVFPAGVPLGLPC
jgi:hypothetical protein